MKRKEIIWFAMVAVAVVLVSKHIIPMFTDSYRGLTIAEIIIGIVFVAAAMIYLSASRRFKAKRYYHLCAGASDGCTQMIPPGVIYCNYCCCVSEQDNAEPIGVH